MKVIVTVLLLVCAIGGNLGLPATSQRQVADDVEMIPPEAKNPYGDQPILDTGVIGIGGFSNPFGGFFENIESVMTRMRQQMEEILRRFNGSTNSTSEFPDISTGGFGVISPFGDVDLSKGNTTSVTKVIDGHKVVINETEYKKEDDFGGAFFKVRIVDVKPNSEEEATTSSPPRDAEAITSPPRDRDTESVDNSQENEITKEAPVSYQNIETFDEYGSDFPYPEGSEGIPIFAENSIDYQPLAVDLSGDTYVNRILEESGATQNPDAEVFDVASLPGRRYGFFAR